MTPLASRRIPGWSIADFLFRHMHLGNRTRFSFRRFAPRTVPLTRHDLVNVGFEKARKQQIARTTATVLDLEREMPNLRSHASRAWQESHSKLKSAPSDSSAKAAEAAAFCDWALLELLLQSGLRIEEASELMLHIEPSKFDRARVIPIGDGQGRVLAEFSGM